MTSSIGRYLTEFRPSCGTANASIAALLSLDGSGDAPAPGPEALARRIAQARDEGVEEGRRLAEAAAEAAMAAEAEAAAAREAVRLDEERRRWADDEAARFADALRQGLEALEGRIADSVTDILQPFLGEAVRRKAVAELGEAITSLLTCGAPRLIAVSGPADIVEALRQTLADVPAAVELRVADTPEVSVLADPTSIRTRMQAWAGRLDQHMREPS
jgi:hypothetical protein